jgi:hypothetical protein
MVSQVKKSEFLYTHLQVGVGGEVDVETPASSAYPQHRWKQGQRGQVILRRLRVTSKSYDHLSANVGVLAC